MFLPFSIVFDNFFWVLLHQVRQGTCSSTLSTCYQLQLCQGLAIEYREPAQIQLHSSAASSDWPVHIWSIFHLGQENGHNNGPVHDLKYRDPPSQLLSWKSVRLSRWRPSILRRSLCIVSGSIQCLSFEGRNSTCSDTKIEGVFCPACLHSGRPAERCRCLPGVPAPPPMLSKIVLFHQEGGKGIPHSGCGSQFACWSISFPK